jgi:hypothetical protein
MPIDPAGLLIAAVVWLGGTVWALNRFCATEQVSPDAGNLRASIATVGWTALASFLVAAGGLFIVWFYEWIAGRT